LKLRTGLYFAQIVAWIVKKVFARASIAHFVVEDIMASYGDYQPQNTEMEGEKDYTAQENTQSTSSISNGSKKRPRDDVVDEASRDRSNTRLNAQLNVQTNASKMRSDER
jgi:hypothetical protein